VACVKNGPSPGAAVFDVVGVGVDVGRAALKTLKDPAANVSGSTCFTAVFRRGWSDSCGPRSNALRVRGLNVFGALFCRVGGEVRKLDKSLTPAPETISFAEGWEVVNAERSEIRLFSVTIGAASWNLSSRKLDRNELCDDCD